MRAPGAAGDDIAVLLQMAAIVLDARLQDSGVIRNLPFHFRDQGIADIGIEGRGIGKSGRGAGHRDPAAGALMQAERVRRTREFEIDQMEAIRNDEAHRARQLLGDIL